MYVFKFTGKCQSAKNNLRFSRKNGNIKDFSRNGNLKWVLSENLKTHFKKKKAFVTLL